MKFNTIKQSINNQFEIITSQGKLIQEQTNKINMLNKNGIIYIDDNEILILDKIPKSEAKNVWRWGLGGFAFSSNGYEGPFETAIDQEGRINANFILSGKIQTNMIEGYDELVTRVSNTDINLNNNYYSKEEVDKHDKDLDQSIVQIKNSVENLITSTEQRINVINETLENGVSKVVTTSSTFDENGLSMEKTGEQMSSKLDWDGFDVTRDKGKATETNMLSVRSNGVNAENVTVRAYLTQKPIRREKGIAMSDSTSVGLCEYWVGE